MTPDLMEAGAQRAQALAAVKPQGTLIPHIPVRFLFLPGPDNTSETVYSA